MRTAASEAALDDLGIRPALADYFEEATEPRILLAGIDGRVRGLGAPLWGR